MQMLQARECFPRLFDPARCTTNLRPVGKHQREPPDMCFAHNMTSWNLRHFSCCRLIMRYNTAVKHLAVLKITNQGQMLTLVSTEVKSWCTSSCACLVCVCVCARARACVCLRRGHTTYADLRIIAYGRKNKRTCPCCVMPRAAKYACTYTQDMGRLPSLIVDPLRV